MQQTWQSSPGHGSLDLMTVLCGGQRSRTVSTGRERRSHSQPQSTAKWGVWQTAQTHTMAFLSCWQRCLSKAFPSSTSFLSSPSSLASFTNCGRPMGCGRAHRAGRHLLLQGVCVRPGQQSAPTWSNHSCTAHDNSAMSGQTMPSWLHGILEKHCQRKCKSTSFFLRPNRMTSFDAGSHLTHRVSRQTYCVTIVKTASRGRMKRAVVS